MGIPAKKFRFEDKELNLIIIGLLKYNKDTRKVELDWSQELKIQFNDGSVYQGYVMIMEQHEYSLNCDQNEEVGQHSGENLRKMQRIEFTLEGQGKLKYTQNCPFELFTGIFENNKP